jgi:hypothetical protein
VIQSQLGGRFARLLLLVLAAPVAAAAFGCSGIGAPAPAPLYPDSLPTFEEKGISVGFDDVQGTRNDSTNCVFSREHLERNYPELSVSGVATAMRFNRCAPERFSSGAAAVDVNGDRLDDVIFSRLSGHPLLYVNESTPGRPKFAEKTSGSGFDQITGGTNGVAHSDIDNDGDADVVLTSLGGPQLYLMINDGGGRFTEEAVARGVAMADGAPHSGMGISFGDYDLDGWIDMHTNEWQSSAVARMGVKSHSRLFRNLGTRGRPGVFEDSTESAGVIVDSNIDATWTFSSIFSDFDGDRYPDLAVVADFNTTKFFWNNGDGTFINTTYDSNLGGEENGMGLAVGFLGADQRPSLFISSIKSIISCEDDSQLIGSGNRLYVYRIARAFDDVTDQMGVRDGGWGWGASFIDATNSGFVDLVQASGVDEPWTQPSGCHAKDPIVYWRNDGTDAYDEVASRVGVVETKSTKAVVVFDADADGRSDLLVTRDADSPLFFHNTTPSVGYRLDLRVKGTTSNRDALGAVVSVTETERGPTKKYLVGTTGSFLAQDSSLLRVGLGGEIEPVRRVEVYFPASQRSVVLNDVERNTVVDVVEPEATVGADS